MSHKDFTFSCISMGQKETFGILESTVVPHLAALHYATPSSQRRPAPSGSVSRLLCCCSALRWTSGGSTSSWLPRAGVWSPWAGGTSQDPCRLWRCTTLRRTAGPTWPGCPGRTVHQEAVLWWLFLHMGQIMAPLTRWWTHSYSVQRLAFILWC